MQLSSIWAWDSGGTRGGGLCVYIISVFVFSLQCIWMEKSWSTVTCSYPQSHSSPGLVGNVNQSRSWSGVEITNFGPKLRQNPFQEVYCVLVTTNVWMLHTIWNIGVLATISTWKSVLKYSKHNSKLENMLQNSPENLHTAVLIYKYIFSQRSKELTKKRRHRIAIRDETEYADIRNISLRQMWQPSSSLGVFSQISLFPQPWGLHKSLS